MKKVITSGLFISFLTLTACMPQSNTGKGGVYGASGGAIAGAIAGQAIGQDTEATLVGAAIGAAVGGLSGAGAGRMMDNQEREMRQALAQSEAAAVRREGNLLAVSLKGDVTFDTGSTEVRPGLFTEIDRITEVLYRYPQTVIIVEGHTDSVGSEQYNMDLSQRRATAVKDLILVGGIPRERIETGAFGETNPIASNETESGRMRNRRVEIKISPASNIQ